MGCLKDSSTAEHFQFQGTFPVWIVGFISISIIPLKANIRPCMECMECATCGFLSTGKIPSYENDQKEQGRHDLAQTHVR